jgi:hypothetical protein
MTSADLFFPGVSLPGVGVQRLEPKAPRPGSRTPKASEGATGSRKLLINPRQASQAAIVRNRPRDAAAEQTSSRDGRVV